MDEELSAENHHSETQHIKVEVSETEECSYVDREEQLQPYIKKEIKVEDVDSDLGIFPDDLRDHISDNDNLLQNECKKEPAQCVPSKKLKKGIGKLFTCEHIDCRKSFETSDKLTYHYVDHGIAKPFVCDRVGCTMAFKSRGELNKHFRVHSDERPYKCIEADCIKSFKTKGELVIHRRVHSDEKFKCHFKGCDKGFKAEYKLKKHMMVHTDGKVFRCSLKGCKEVFKEKSDFKSHQTIHPPEKIICTYPGCNAVLQICSYNKHQQMHNCGKQYRCNFNQCTAAFYRNSHLRRHVRTHTGEKFFCNFQGCEKSFSSKEWMAKHQRKHNEPIDANRKKFSQEGEVSTEVSFTQPLEANKLRNVQHCTICEVTFSEEHEFQEHFKNCGKFNNFEFVEVDRIKSEDVSFEVKSEFEYVEDTFQH